MLKHELMVVTKWPTSIKKISALLGEAGYETDFYLTSVIKGRSNDNDPTTAEIKALRPRIDQEIEKVQPRWILVFGNEALLAVTGHSGIMKHRGQIYPRKNNPNIKVMGTLSPAAIEISPGYRKGFVSDLRFFVTQIKGPPVKNKVPYKAVLSDETFNELIHTLQGWPIHGVCYDLETVGFDEWKSDAAVISCALSLWYKEDTDVREIWAIPLYHPESPFKDSWKDYFNTLADLIKNIPVRVAFNSKFDNRWFAEFCDEITATFDPMLAAHLLDENRAKSLESLAREELVEQSWKLPSYDLLNEPLKKVLRYNGKDTLHTARLYFKLREQLRKRPRLAKILTRLLMPNSNLLVQSEHDGLWVNKRRHSIRWEKVRNKLHEIDSDLMKWVPASTPYQINFNTSNFLRWFVYDHLELPILERTKTGQPSLGIAIKHKLKNEHPVMELLIERSKYSKYETAFFSTWHELMDSNSRLHPNFKLHGTVTGRLSSGKMASDGKVVARAQKRGFNVQQIPQDIFVRSNIGAPPDWVFVEADLSQIEFRLAMMLANDQTGLQLLTEGKDIHRVMAARITGKPESTVTKIERSNAKPANFLLLFGATWRTFVETAWKEYQIEISDDDAKAIRRIFYQTYTEIGPWHEKQRRFVRKHGYVTTLTGRIRRLPDIFSSDDRVRYHAEMQAINTPIQSLASELTQIAYMVITKKIRHLKLAVKSLGTVHDSLMFEAHRRDIPQLLPIIKETMENPPLKQLFGVELWAPIVAEITTGQHWGEGKELTIDEIYNWNGEGLE
ncbi:MAG: hypothetical protein LC778_10170 [Acidobacteria bacterium]|nr:hypothetical protein [Acidobacteriota bacterium]